MLLVFCFGTMGIISRAPTLLAPQDRELIERHCPLLLPSFLIIPPRTLEVQWSHHIHCEVDMGQNVNLYQNTTSADLTFWLVDHTGKASFHSKPKEGNAKECSDYCTIALISHASKVVFKILQARLQQYVNRELPDVLAGLRKGRGTRDQIANICWIITKAREFQKNIYFCFIDYAKAFDCVDHNKLWKTLKEIGIPDHLTCLLSNLYVLIWP